MIVKETLARIGGRSDGSTSSGILISPTSARGSPLIYRVPFPVSLFGPITEAQAETIWGILQECGVGSIEIISRDTMLDGLYNTDDIGYRIRTEDGNNPVLYLNGAGEVSQIRWANQTLYPKS